MVPIPSTVGHALARRAGAVLALALLAGCVPPAAPAAAPDPGEWRSFEGAWSASGEARPLEAGGVRPAAVLDVTGSLLLTGERGLGVGFQSRAIAYSDGVSGSVGRAVWTDERGDRIFSALRGAPVATGSRVTGTFTGGTGRWAGIEGEYAFEWAYVIEAEDRIQGRAVGLKGRARIVRPGGAAP